MAGFTPTKQGQPFKPYVDELQAAIGEWRDWTPTVTQSGAVALTVTEAKYCLVGKTCHIYARVMATSAGTVGFTIDIGGIPSAAQPALSGADVTAGTGCVVDGATPYYGIVVLPLANKFQLRDSKTQGLIGNSPSVLVDGGDVISFQATYRVA